MALRLRPASPADRPVLESWEAAPHIAAAGIADWEWQEMLAEDPPWREILIAEVGDIPIGAVQIIDPAEEDSHYWGDCGPNLRAVDIWIGEAAYLGQGHGRAMMQGALARCFAPDTVEAVLIDPLATNTKAHRFYKALGFEFQGPRRFEDDLCHVYKLTRRKWREGATNA